MGAHLALTTRCPHCGATFDVDFPALQRRKGLVRCSACASIFDAYEAVVPAVPSAASAVPEASVASDPSGVPDSFDVSGRRIEESQSAPIPMAGRREPVWSEQAILGRSPRPIASSPAAWRLASAAAPPDREQGEAHAADDGEPFELPGDQDAADHGTDLHEADAIGGRGFEVAGPPPLIGDARVAADDDQGRTGPAAAIPLRGRAVMQAEAADPDAPGSGASFAEPWLSREPTGQWPAAGPTFHLGQAPSTEPPLQGRVDVPIGASAETDDGPRFDEDEHEPLPARLPELRDEGSRWMRVVWSVCCVAAGACLLLQLIYVYRGQLAAFAPTLRPVLEQACVSLGCEVPYERRIDDITIMRSALRAQPAAGEAGRSMELSLTLRNQHRRPQAWPTLVLDLTDLSGARVVSMQLPPARYLSSEALAGPFPATSDAEIALVLRLGDVQVNGYQLDKFFP